MLSCPQCQTLNLPEAKFCKNCGAFMGVQAGQVMNGRYRITRPLSKGGMGAIYLAEDQGAFGKLRVIKEMLDYVDPDPDPAAYQQAVQKARQRFEDEARTLSALKHKSIPDIHHFFSENNRNYIVMEYVEGRDLEKQLSHYDDRRNLVPGKAYPVADVIAYGIQICRVLEYLSRQQPRVIHHDIKPANIILDPHGDVKLVDFGTARARMAVQPGGRLGLQKSSVYGTVGYAPPEQYQAKSEPRSDVYALAATLYHLLTDDDPRTHPFSFPQLSQLPTDLWKALDAALQQDVAQRPTAARFQAQLERLLAPTNHPAQPFHFRGGAVAHNAAELAQACVQQWEDGKYHLYRQDFERQLRQWGRNDLEAKAAHIRQTQPNQDIGLDAFLRTADPRLPPPRLVVKTPRLDAGVAPWGGAPRRQMVLENQGVGCLTGRISNLPNWIEASALEFVAPERQVIDLVVNSAALTPRAQPYQAVLALTTGHGQTAQVTVQVQVPEPCLQVRPEQLDLGRVRQGQTVQASLHLANLGGSPCGVRAQPDERWLQASPPRVDCPPGQAIVMQLKVETRRMGLGVHNGRVRLLAEAGGWQQQVELPVQVELPWLKTFWARYKAPVSVVAVVVLALLINGIAYAYQQAQLAACYRQGATLFDAQEWLAATNQLADCGDYRDAATLALAARYRAGEFYREQRQWNAATAAFIAAGGYQDAPAQVLETHYQAGMFYREQKLWKEAIELFTAAGIYQDAPTQLLETHYQAAEFFRGQGAWLDALSTWSRAGDYRDARAQYWQTYEQARAAGALQRTAPADGMVQVYVPGGTFPMGSTDGPDNERPVHDVRLDGFWLDQTEVTNSQYARCVAAGACRASRYVDDSRYNGDNYPVVGVDWHNAAAYCAWAGRRLPTEAEWEYAARGPEAFRYPWGDETPGCNIANFKNCVGGAVEVGSYPDGASWVGALDMAGNAWEWVNDWYDAGYYANSPAENPDGPTGGRTKALRGGAWYHSSYQSVRAANRSNHDPANAYFYVGFRCAQE
jgi:formylglycine-generating enzyme required for sulfatase activity/serine/threonine protein kinase